MVAAAEVAVAAEPVAEAAADSTALVPQPDASGTNLVWVGDTSAAFLQQAWVPTGGEDGGAGGEAAAGAAAPRPTPPATARRARPCHPPPPRAPTLSPGRRGRALKRDGVDDRRTPPPQAQVYVPTAGPSAPTASRSPAARTAAAAAAAAVRAGRLAVWARQGAAAQRMAQVPQTALGAADSANPANGTRRYRRGGTMVAALGTEAPLAPAALTMVPRRRRRWRRRRAADARRRRRPPPPSSSAAEAAVASASPLASPPRRPPPPPPP